MRWVALLMATLFSWFPWVHHSAVTRPAPIIKSVLTTKKVMALTFDDGPTKKWTPQVLSVLKQNHIRATFFVIGSAALRSPELLRDELDAHMEIGSHGFSHIILRKKTPQAVQEEIQQNEALLTSLHIPKPVLYRLPAGSSDSTSLSVLGAMHYHVIGWSIDTRDWRHRMTAEQMAALVEHQAAPGAIVIFHDGPNSSSATVNAVKLLVPALQAKGYHFDTVSELLKLESFASR